MNIPGPFDFMILAGAVAVAVFLYFRFRHYKEEYEREVYIDTTRREQRRFAHLVVQALRDAAAKNGTPLIPGVGPIVVDEFECHGGHALLIRVSVPHGEYRRLGPQFLGKNIRGTIVLWITVDFGLSEGRQICILREFPNKRRSEMPQADFEHILPELLGEVAGLNIAEILQNKENLPPGVRFDPIWLGKNADDRPCENCGGLATTEARVDGSEVRIPCCDGNPCRAKIAGLATEQAAECGA